MYKSMKECGEMIDDLLENGRGLTEWEENFLDSIWGKEELTPKQREVLDRIFQEKGTRIW